LKVKYQYITLFESHGILMFYLQKTRYFNR
jgi:hypothetical protein